MSGDELARPRTGTAVGVPYVALPPTAADADPDGTPPLIVAWPGRRPPRTQTALAAAVPMTGIPGWRVYAGLPDGPDDGAVVEFAAGRAPALVAEVRTDLGLADGPIGLAGFSLGATVALRVLARREVAVTAAALIAPLPDAELSGQDGAAAIAAGDPALLLAGGGNDDAVPPSELAALRDRLRTAGVSDVELATFRMGHALAAEPGTEARPQIAEAISVDAAVTDWFRDHLGVRPRGLSDPAPARGAAV
ncbi:MAG TPA: dienelactone hydrolase family protein [Streptosporangiaceae bacterium]|nr:dienelactone hydrolase family protein [Streptosporangiaceae bacterium]